MAKPVLVIMAAGLGHRFGGPKQITPLDEHGHLIIDYSIYDAIRAGFEEVILIINPKMQKDFDETIGMRAKDHIRISYAYQTLDQLPEGFTVPEGREKPWGTAHAVLCAKDLIGDRPFAAINADDFYGREAYKVLFDYLVQENAPTEHAMVSYNVENTLSENGSVARGVCEVDANGYLTSITERTQIFARPYGAAYTEDGVHFVDIPAGTVVSLNFWGFQPGFTQEIESRFAAFLTENLPVNPLKCEYFLPSIPNQLIKEGTGSVKVLRTGAKWHGVTYHDDLALLQNTLKGLKEAGLYPDKLWN